MDLDLQVFHAGSPLGTPKRGRTTLPVCSTPIENGESYEEEEEDVITFLQTLDEFINSCNTSLSSSTCSEGADANANLDRCKTTPSRVLLQHPISMRQDAENASCKPPRALLPDLGPGLTADSDGIPVSGPEPKGLQNAQGDSAASPHRADTEYFKDDESALVLEQLEDSSVQIITDLVLTPDDNRPIPGSAHVGEPFSGSVAGHTASSSCVRSSTVTTRHSSRAVGTKGRGSDEVEVIGTCINLDSVTETADAVASVEDADGGNSTVDDTLIDLAGAEAASAVGTNANGKADDGDGGSPETGTAQDSSDVTLVEDNTPGTAEQTASSKGVATDVRSCRLEVVKNTDSNTIVAKASQWGIKLDPALSEVLLIGLLMCPNNTHEGDSRGCEKSRGHLVETGTSSGKADPLHREGSLSPASLEINRKDGSSPVLAVEVCRPAILSTALEDSSPARDVETDTGRACSSRRDRSRSPESTGKECSPPVLSTTTHKPAILSAEGNLSGSACSLETVPERAWLSSTNQSQVPGSVRKECTPSVPLTTTHEPAISTVEHNVASPAQPPEAGAGSFYPSDREECDSSVLAAAEHEPVICSGIPNVTSMHPCSQPTYFTEISRSLHEMPSRTEECQAGWAQDISQVAIIPTPSKKHVDYRAGVTGGLLESYPVDWAHDNSAVANIPTPGVQKPRGDLLPRFRADWSRDDDSTPTRILTPGPPGLDEKERRRGEDYCSIEKGVPFSLEKWLETSAGKEDGTLQTSCALKETVDEKPGDVLLLDLENDDVSFVEDIVERHEDDEQMEEFRSAAVEPINIATVDLRHKINSLRGNASSVVEEPSGPTTMSTAEVKTEVQEVGALTPVEGVPFGLLPLPVVEAPLIKSEVPSKDIRQETRVHQPFFSEDPEENKDNANPAWENIRQLTTDEERYEAVRNVWHNETIPDPNSNLSRYRHMTRQQGAPRKRTLCKGRKRKASGSISNNPPKRIRMDTDIFDLKLRELERKTNDDYSAAQQALELNLQKIRQQVNAQMANHGYGHHRSATAPWDMRYWQQHQEELLHYKFMTATQNIRNKYSVRASRLLDARREVRHFNKFYMGLCGLDPTTLTDWQMAEQLKIEKILGHFKLCYGEAKG